MILIETKQVPEQRTWSFNLSVSANDRTHFRPFYRQHRTENDWTTSRLRPIVDASAGIHGTKTWSHTWTDGWTCFDPQNEKY